MSISQPERASPENASIASRTSAEDTAGRAVFDLFLISFLLLFLELACIRWFSAHIMFLSYFSNVILLGSFLGISLGCLAAGRERHLLPWSPVALTTGMLIGIWSALQTSAGCGAMVDLSSADHVFFGRECAQPGTTAFLVPVQLFCAAIFLLVTAILAGPGQELGRTLNLVPERVKAYTVNILGSIAGIGLFTCCSRFEVEPFWWFIAIVFGMAYFLIRRRMLRHRVSGLIVVFCLFVLPYLASTFTGTWTNASGPHHFHWSPYDLIQHSEQTGGINANFNNHQGMYAEEAVNYESYKYAFPHLLQRDSGGAPFKDVLVIGAGSGNDVSRALQWGAEHVDAVEIDPVIQRIGARAHPNRPYQDPRVTVQINDGRNFLRRADRQADRRYDLIIYALVDSLVLHGSHSSIRLESFLFTREAFADVRRLLKPNGVFAVYNFFRQGWIVGRLSQTIAETFGKSPLVMSFPWEATIGPDSKDGYTVILAGNTDGLAAEFARHPAYSLSLAKPPAPGSPNGFLAAEAGTHTALIRLSRVEVPPGLETPSDDWPFLYLRNPMIPDLSRHGVLIMGIIAACLILFVMPRPTQGGTGPCAAAPSGKSWRMFFLGVGFMLIETKGVVQMSLLFGSTWLVNSLVFLAVLVMILVANLFVLRFQPQRQGVWYLLLFAALGLNHFIPLGSFLGIPDFVRLGSSCLLVFTPILLAGIIFSTSFATSRNPDADLGFNTAGAMAGGLLENLSMLLGFRHLIAVAAVAYLLSFLSGRKTTDAASC